MYTGREYDRWLKLYYNRARYYDSKLARFISRDPIDIADDVNLYSYVGNNSMKYLDLMGTEKKWIKENEWTTWYFDTIASDNLVWHSWLYFIHEWQDYLLSYYPLNARQPWSLQEDDIFLDSQVTVNWKWWNYKWDLTKVRNELFWNKVKQIII